MITYCETYLLDNIHWRDYESIFKSFIVYFLLLFLVYLKKNLCFLNYMSLTKEKEHTSFPVKSIREASEIEGDFLVDWQAWFDWCSLTTSCGNYNSPSPLLCWSSPPSFFPTLPPCLDIAFSSLLTPLSIPTSNWHWFLPHPSHKSVILKD